MLLHHVMIFQLWETLSLDWLVFITQALVIRMIKSCLPAHTAGERDAGVEADQQMDGGNLRSDHTANRKTPPHCQKETLYPQRKYENGSKAEHH